MALDWLLFAASIVDEQENRSICIIRACHFVVDNIIMLLASQVLLGKGFALALMSLCEVASL